MLITVVFLNKSLFRHLCNLYADTSRPSPQHLFGHHCEHYTRRTYFPFSRDAPPTYTNPKPFRLFVILLQLCVFVLLNVQLYSLELFIFAIHNPLPHIYYILQYIILLQHRQIWKSKRIQNFKTQYRVSSIPPNTHSRGNPFKCPPLKHLLYLVCGNIFNLYLNSRLLLIFEEIMTNIVCIFLENQKNILSLTHNIIIIFIIIIYLKR